MRVLLSVQLLYDVGERSVHCPMVASEIHGVPTKLIVDTGATEHLLTLDLADRVALSYDRHSPGTDIAGSAVAGYEIGAVEISLGEMTLSLNDVVAIEGPAPFAAWGIGGFLSPQRLCPEATVVVDLISDRLLVIEGSAEGIRTQLDEEFEGYEIISGDRHSAGTLGVLAAVVPHHAVVALLDTGAASTDVSAVAVPGDAALPTEAVAKGVSGAAIEAGSMPEQTLAVGEARLFVPILGVRDSIPQPDGASVGEEPDAMIGMDVLAGTVVVIPPERLGRFWWFVGAPEGGGSGSGSR